MADQLTGYYAPKNFNIWYFFGSLALLVFVMQIVTGIFITMHFKPGEATAFNSVEYLRREVPYGWLLQYMHAVGASFFFIVVYLHMARAFLYGSYKGPRELLWVFGMLIYLALMAEAFMGYVLPYGNMSYWGAQVIINLFGTIPGIGPDLVEWIRGDYGIGDSTLTRFFSLHVIALPFILALLILLHLVALRQVGSNNPDGIEIKENLGADGKPKDGIPFHPYYTLKDIVGVGLFLTAFAIVVFFIPTFGGLFLEASGQRLCRRVHGGKSTAGFTWSSPPGPPASDCSSPVHVTAPTPSLRPRTVPVMRQVFHDQLDAVFRDLAAICGDVEQAVRLATAALLTGDAEIAERVPWRRRRHRPGARARRGEGLRAAVAAAAGRRRPARRRRRARM